MQDVVVRRMAMMVTLFLLGALSLGRAQDGRNPNKFDGPAELPRVHVKSALSDTPAPGKSILVANAADFRSAIDKAACGDTIRLQAGSEFAGNFKFPAKSCDDAHWIVVRTSAADKDLPPEGSRINPCYAGVSSLPGRPRYTCASSANVTAKIVHNSGGSGPISFSEGANHYRFIGLEITRDSPALTIYNLTMFSNNNGGDHIIFDRVWMHGGAQDETTRGIMLGATRHVAVVDSYFSDFHCIAKTGGCVDSQAIAGGLGNSEMGPYKIVNNFLEGAGENIIFGGGPATVVPADIEIRRNHLFKPAIWREGASGFVGGASGSPFIVKNNFELKTGQRVLIEGNVLENSWGGFSQTGFSVLFTSKNQGGKCPVCKVTDVTFRYNRITHCASGFQIATALSGGTSASNGTERISIHDVIIDDIGGQSYGGFGAFAQITSGQPTLRDLSISHVTAFAPRTLFILGAPVEQRMTNFTFTNNLVAAGQQDIFPPGGGDKNCSFQPAKQTPTGVLKSCFENYTFSHNAIVGSKGGWPKGNSNPPDHAAVGLADFSEGRYRLCRDKHEANCKNASPALRAGTDGKDLGADVEAVVEATKGAQ